MAHRPHFAYRTPPGYLDERAEFPFDYRNIGNGDPQTVPLPATGLVLNQVLRLDEDAPFLWRGISWECPIFTQLQAFLDGAIAIRLRDAYGNYLSNDFVPILNYAQPYYVWQPWNQPGALTGPLWVAPSAGGMGVPWADEMWCPPSSVLQIDILLLQPYNIASPLTLNAIGRFMARGVKRRPIAECGGSN